MKNPFKSLWTVEKGEYSDHRILAVFETEKDANAWKDALANDPEGWASDAFVSQMELVPRGIKPFYVDTYSIRVVLWDDGRAEPKTMSHNRTWAIDTMFGWPSDRPSVRYLPTSMRGRKSGLLEVRGSTEKSVLKVMSERIAHWRAGTLVVSEHTDR